MLDKSGFSNTFDFFYLPVDFRNRCNLGYAFVNFLDARSAGRLYRQYHNKVRGLGGGAVPARGRGDPCCSWLASLRLSTLGPWDPGCNLQPSLLPSPPPPPAPQRWEEHNSRKTCEVTYGRVQGREALVQHFRSSKFPSDDAGARLPAPCLACSQTQAQRRDGRCAAVRCGGVPPALRTRLTSLPLLPCPCPAEFMPLVYTRVEGGRASRPLPIHAYIASTEGGDAEAGAPAAEGAPAEPARQADA